ncbi:MAG: tyrosine-type recombinase/integrase [Candidatus Dormibacteria bacterium]
MASDIDENGNEKFPRTWNTDFIDAPQLIPSAQYAPIVAPGVVSKAIRKGSGVFPCLYALLAGSGLRISEALALKMGDDGQSDGLDLEMGLIHIRKTLKTPSAARKVDICDALANFLRKNLSTPIGEAIFLTKKGKPLAETTGYNHLKKDGIPGFHSFRRFRNTHLENTRIPSTLIKYWMGHSASGDMTQRYSKFEDLEIRKDWCHRAGLGFNLPDSKEEKDELRTLPDSQFNALSCV